MDLAVLFQLSFLPDLVSFRRYVHILVHTRRTTQVPSIILVEVK